MLINQFYDTGLAHASYAVVRNGQMIVVDPGRDPQPYYDFATLHEATIVGVIETHPHADFVSAHLEIHHQTSAVIYISKLAGAAYPHEGFDDGDEINLSDIKLRAINTPGHSPDSICILVIDEAGHQQAVFTGDTLFAGDVGRPDLRESAGNLTAGKEELARQLYHSTRHKLMHLPHEVTVYPAHGPGSLCGKNMSPDLQSTIGKEIRENYALQLMDELQFVQLITHHQPFVPRYFPYDVELNRQGAAGFEESVTAVPRINHHKLTTGIPVIDTRPSAQFKAGHIPGSINLQDGGKFETWLGSIMGADEKFYLVAADEEAREKVIRKAAKIGYEVNILSAMLLPKDAAATSAELNLTDFKQHPSRYTIVDARNHSEIEDGKMFAHALEIPLPELRERVSEIPQDKPIVVHCAAGYRSAAAASIISGTISNVPVYDLSDEITNFPPAP